MNTKLKGTFLADGKNKVLRLDVEVQALTIWNDTQAADTNNGYGYKYEWTEDGGTSSYQTYHPAADNTAANTVIATGINQVDTFNYTIGASVSVTAGTDITKPLYSTASTAGMSAGTIVRLVTTDQKNLHGLPFTVSDVTLNTSFEMANTLATAPGIVAGANGFYKIIAPNREVYDIIFPNKRNICDISQATSAVVTVMVDHGYSVGQIVRINVPAACGMIEMNGKEGKITAITTGTFTVNINSTAFTAFKFPLAAVANFTPASVIPHGDSLTLGYDGATSNKSFRGFVLAGGTALPAGTNGDTIRWVAEKAADVV